MLNLVENFLSLFLACAADAAAVKCGDARALSRLFNGTAYSQRRKEWFPEDISLLPSRTIGRQDFEILKSCILAAKKTDGVSAINEQTIEDLSKAYIPYFDAMRRLDARRERSLSARSLSTTDAIARLERLAMSHGCVIRDFNDTDCFRNILVTEQEKLILENPREATHIAHALCVLLTSSKKTAIEERMRIPYLMRSAGLGMWAGWFVGGDVYARLFYRKYLEKINANENNSFCSFFIAGESVTETGVVHRDFFDVIDLNIGDAPLAWSLYDVHPGFLLGELAIGALRVGVPLEQRCNLLGGRSPEMAFNEYIELASKHGSGRSWVWFVPRQFIAALGLVGRFEEARLMLEEVQKNAAAWGSQNNFFELHLAECEASLLRVQWLRERTPKSLAEYAMHTERTAGLAESLNLPLHARSLRATLMQSVEQAPARCVPAIS